MYGESHTVRYLEIPLTCSNDSAQIIRPCASWDISSGKSCDFCSASYLKIAIDAKYSIIFSIFNHQLVVQRGLATMLPDFLSCHTQNSFHIAINTSLNQQFEHHEVSSNSCQFGRLRERAKCQRKPRSCIGS